MKMNKSDVIEITLLIITIIGYIGLGIIGHRFSIKSCDIITKRFLRD
jgi:hypothetical protein